LKLTYENERFHDAYMLDVRM